METTTEISKQIDGVYKNLADSFHPQTRDLLTAAKAYLKALHGSTAAYSLYLEAMTKFTKSVSKLNQERAKEFEATIATRLDNLHTQQLAFLKSFYIDFILPIENNLERDVKVVQQHHRNFNSQKQRTLESFKKASSTVKKLKKKKLQIYGNRGNLDKEIRGLQTYQEERDRVEDFFEQSLKDVVSMEMRRFEFIFEKQEMLFAQQFESSSYSSDGGDDFVHGKRADEALISKSSSETTLIMNLQQLQREDSITNNGMMMEEDVGKPPSQPAPPPPPPPPPPQFMTHTNLPPPNKDKQDQKIVVEKKITCKAIYSYKKDDEEDDDGFHQLLSFEEGDLVAMSGPTSPFGWQYGENTRTKKSGWFPMSYVNMDSTSGPQSLHHTHNQAIYSTLEKAAPLPEVDYDLDDDDDHYLEEKNTANLQKKMSFFGGSCGDVFRNNNNNSIDNLDLIMSLDNEAPNHHHHHHHKLSPTTLSRSASFASSTTTTNNKRPKLFTKLIKRTMSFVTMGRSDVVYLDGHRGMDDPLPWDDMDEFRFGSLNVGRAKNGGGGGGGGTFGGWDGARTRSNVKESGGGGGKARARGRWDDLWGDVGEDYYFGRRTATRGGGGVTGR